MTFARESGRPDDDALLEELLAPVLDLEAAEQERALTEVCAAHPSLAPALRRRHAVLAHFGLASDPGLDPATGSPALRQFGPYRILGTLGQGGMGIVHLAEDPVLGRTVALKLIRHEFLHSERARERFRREVAIAARLDHPGLCTVYGAGEVDGQPYLVLRHVPGRSLDQMLQAARAERNTALFARMPPRGGQTAPDLHATLRLVEAVARALHAAHEAGLVHRDVKPGNVMVGPSGEPVVMDFGLARDNESSAADLTQSSDPVGTPAYMAPEQVRGGDVDRRTDVHALGAMLYECLTLRAPYAGRDREDLYRRILTESPVPLRDLQPAASGDLATVLATALAKDPTRRYATALAFADDLRAVLEGRPTVARPPGLALRAWALARVHPTLAAVGAALLLGLGVALVLLEQSRSTERTSRAVAMVLRAGALREDPELEFAVLQAALDMAPEPEVIAALNGVLPELQEWRLEREAGGRVEGLTPSPSRRWILVTGQGIKAAVHRADGSFWCELPWPVVPQRPAVAFSPDEHEMLVCRRITGERDFIRIVRCDLRGTDVKTSPFADVPRFTGPGERAAVTALAWSAQGHVVATCTGGATGRSKALVFDATGKVQRQLPLPNGARGCAWLADGRIALPIGIWDHAGLVVRFDLADGGVWPSQPQHVFVAGDHTVVVSTAGYEVFDGSGVRRHGQLRDIGARGQQLWHAEVATDGTLLLTFNDGLIWRVDPDFVHQSWQEDGTVHSAHFFQDGQRIVAGDWRGRITIRDRDGNLMHQWRGHRHGAQAVPLGDGAQLLTGSWDGALKVWSPGTVRGLPHRSGWPRLQLLRVGDNVVVASDDGRLFAVDPAGRVFADTHVGPGTLRMHPHHDGRSVWISTVTSQRLWRWTPATGELPLPLDLAMERTAEAASVAHAAECLLLVGSGWQNAIRVFDPASGAALAVPEGARPTGLLVAASAGVAVVLDIGGRIQRLDDSGAVLWTVNENEADGDAASVAAPTCLQPSDDGRLLVVGRDDGSVSLWDLQTRARIERWRDHQQRVRAVAIDASGRRIASCSSVGHLVVREVGRQRPLLEWRSDGETLESVAFAGAHAVVTGGWRHSGRLRWWWWDPEVLRQQLRGVPVPVLTAEQQHRRAEVLRNR